MYFRALIIYLLSCLIVQPAVAISWDSEDLSRFHKITRALTGTPNELSGNFATTAIVILIEVYLAEIDLARAQAKARENKEKLLSWAGAVEHYTEQLPLMLDDIKAGYPVELRHTNRGFVEVRVAGRAIILNHPRADQQTVFEQRIIGDYCQRNNCAAVASYDQDVAPIPVSAPTVNPDWSFTKRGPVCSNEGISVQFSASAQLLGLRGICKQFFQELSSLALEIQWQRSHAVDISWYRISIVPTPQRPGHIVSLNAVGDVTLLSLPLLYSSPELLRAMVPWLREKSSGADTNEIQIDAASYGWETRSN